MIWISQHWQTLAAAGIVATTVLVFLLRAFRRKGSSCGGGCDCGVEKP